MKYGERPFSPGDGLALKTRSARFFDSGARRRVGAAAIDCRRVASRRAPGLGGRLRIDVQSRFANVWSWPRLRRRRETRSHARGMSRDRRRWRRRRASRASRRRRFERALSDRGDPDGARVRAGRERYLGQGRNHGLRRPRSHRTTRSLLRQFARRSSSQARRTIVWRERLSRRRGHPRRRRARGFHPVGRDAGGPVHQPEGGGGLRGHCGVQAERRRHGDPQAGEETPQAGRNKSRAREPRALD